jgi:MFS family permease
MAETLAWLNAVFDHRGSGYLDDRGGAIGLLLLGLILLGWPLSGLLPLIVAAPRGATLGWRPLLVIAVVPAILTPLLLYPLPADFLSVPIGGYLSAHFAVYGLTTAALLWWQQGRPAIRMPQRGERLPLARTLLAILASTVYVAGVMGYALDTQVTSFALTAPRVPLFVAMLVGTACYFVTADWLTRGPGSPKGAYLVTKACFLLSLGLAVALSFEELFFLIIIAAIILLYFIVYGLFGSWIYAATRHPLVGAVANAIAFAWALSVTFPLLAGG